MKVRMKVSVSGTRNGEPWPARGSVVELPDAEAADYCKSGMAEPITTLGEDIEKRDDAPSTGDDGPDGPDADDAPMTTGDVPAKSARTRKG